LSALELIRETQEEIMKLVLIIAALILATPAMAHHGKSPGNSNGHYCGRPSSAPSTAAPASHSGICGLFGLCW
jgi:hypothetical protein